MDLAAVMRKLAAHEPRVHQDASEMTRADFETAVADDFWEVGAPGAVEDREHVCAVLTDRGARSEGECDATEFGCRALGAETYPLTSRLCQGADHAPGERLGARGRALAAHLPPGDDRAIPPPEVRTDGVRPVDRSGRRADTTMG